MKYLFSFFILFHSLIAEQKPNIIIIYSDDMGYNQLGVTGCSKYKTDAIDSIAKDGVLFTNGYVSGPVCAPSRAGLMTGRYQIRYGYESFTGPISSFKLNKNFFLFSTTNFQSPSRIAVCFLWRQKRLL